MNKKLFCIYSLVLVLVLVAYTFGTQSVIYHFPTTHIFGRTVTHTLNVFQNDFASTAHTLEKYTDKILNAFKPAPPKPREGFGYRIENHKTIKICYNEPIGSRPPATEEKKIAQSISEIIQNAPPKDPEPPLIPLNLKRMS